MKHNKLEKAATLVFVLALLSFGLFFLYLNHAESIQVYQTRQPGSYTQVTDYSKEQVTDAAAPVGVRNIYRWTLEESDTNENCLCMLTVHQAVQVQINGELVYSMAPDPDNRLSQTPGTNWNVIPLYPEDAGSVITVTLTPLFPNVVDYGAEFWCGSRNSILFGSFSDEIPNMILSILCMLLGIFILLVQLYYSLSANVRDPDMFYLGSFSFLLGLWYLTFQDSLTILFAEHTVLSQYVNIGSLFLTSIPLGLYAATFFRHSKVLITAAIAASCSALAVLLLQLLGIRDMKENLTLCHIALIVTVLLIFAFALFRKKQKKNNNKALLLSMMLLVIGVIVDIGIYITDERSGGCRFTVIAFLLYTIVMFASNIVKVSRQAYRDANTGLSNKLRWNELMQEDAVTDSCAILVCDLNGLKQVNDTLGHDAGDQMIFDCSNILLNTLPRSSVICRWGGDEFAVMLSGTSREQLNHHIQALLTAAEVHSTENPHLPITFAVGSALSSEHPGSSRADLFRLADEDMYRNKQIWYAEKVKTAN